MRALALAAGLALVAGPALADDALIGALKPLGFMIGDWRGDGQGVGAGAGGDSSIHPDLGGRVLIRRDHVLTKAGGAFDIYMLIYPDAAGLRAEFVDTEGHTIHYAATPGDGPSVRFNSPGTAQAPGFRLSYAAAGVDRLHIRFEIAPPGGGFKVYSEGDVVRR
ncbi:MAG TPA: hypothetical protein VKQ70_17145 [Caulobacteraceae bacterium]|jgi:hypothetical protein|nr:hypothetical protein [Caulobacteraceae bacterium]